MSRPRLGLAALVFCLGLGAGRGSGQSADASPQPSFDWSGCTVAEHEGTVREVTCPAFVMRVWRSAALADAAGLAAIATTLPQAAGGAPGQLRVGSMTAPTWESAEVLLAAPLPSVVTMCAAPIAAADARRAACRAAMVSIMVRRSLPPAVSFPASQRRFLGADLVIPEGCTSMGPERVGCERTGAAIDWREQAARAGESSTSVLSGVAQLLRARLTIEEETPSSCSMRGVTGEGLRLEASVAGQAVDVAVCAVVRDGTKAVAQCMGRLPSGSAWPVPCDAVFDGVIP